MGIPLSIPNLAGNELKYLKECIDTNFVSSVGKFVSDFEKEFAKYLNVNYAVAMSSGTSALHISLIILGVGEGDDVLAPNLTFVAPLNAVKYVGANPVLIDSEWSTLGMCPDSLKKTIGELYEKDQNDLLINKKTGNTLKAILPMHTFGNACLMDEIMALAKSYGLAVIEDASESLGAKYGEVQTGTIGNVGCFSFNGNKIITSGGGGMLVTNDEHLATRARHLSTTAKTDPIKFVHDSVGYNYRMVNLLAAVGLAQLEQLPSFLEKKKENFKKYQDILGKIKSPYFDLHTPEEGQSNYWFYSLVLKDEYAKDRDKIIDYFLENGVQVRPIWELMENLEPYVSCLSFDLKSSRDISSRIINIPCSTGLSVEEIETVCNTIRKLEI